MSSQANIIVFPYPVNLAVYTTPPAPRLIENVGGRGILVVVNLLTPPDSNSLTVIIEGLDPISGKFYPLLTSNPLATEGLTVLKVYPGLNEIDGLKANSPIGKNVRIRCVHENEEKSMCYGISATLVV